MTETNFENLSVYRLSENLADEVREIVVGWNDLAKDPVGKQLVRSADSIGASVAEGERRGSFQDYRRFIKIARRYSLQETQHRLCGAFNRSFSTRKQTATLKPLVDEFAPALNACSHSTGKATETEDKGQRTKDQTK